MSRRSRLLAPLAALALQACLTGGAAADGLPTLTVHYANGAPLLTLASGSLVGAQSAPGTLIPAGTYNVDFAVAGGSPDFQLTGPGVNIFDAEPAEAVWAITFAPSSTYTYLDGSFPESTTMYFSTGATIASATAPIPVVGGSPVANSDPVGAATRAAAPASALRGLSAAVSPSGVVLRFHGQPVTRLAAGRYVLALSDTSTSAGLGLQRRRGRAIVLTGRSFVGLRTVTISLSAGDWTLTGGTGATRSFVVTR